MECSLSDSVLASLGDFTCDAWVGGHGVVGSGEVGASCGDELAVVRRAAVTDDDLGRVLVGHDSGGAGESAAGGVGVVTLKGLPDHAGVKVGSNLESVLSEGAGLAGAHLGQVLGFFLLVEADHDSLTAFHDHLAASAHSSVLENGI